MSYTPRTHDTQIRTLGKSWDVSYKLMKHNAEQLETELNAAKAELVELERSRDYSAQQVAKLSAKNGELFQELAELRKDWDRKDKAIRRAIVELGPDRPMMEQLKAMIVMLKTAMSQQEPKGE